MVGNRCSSARASPLVLVALLVAVTIGVDGCGSGTGRSSGDKLRVAASFYPLQWMAEQVGGRYVDVETLTKPGAEPHDLELSPRDVAAVQKADVVVYLSGFQPSVDDAVDQTDGSRFDARSSADLDLTFTPIEGGKQQAGEAGSSDPHFWLDPSRLAKVARAFAITLQGADPDHADAYATNVRAVTARLGLLDRQFARSLRGCRAKDLVTSHNAFGYLARRYGLSQVGVTGLTPEEEPSPSDLAAVTDFVEAHHVRTIYFETLISPRIARAVAKEAKVDTDVLDPIEGLNDRSQGRDYLEVMRSNRRNLVKGQPCP